RGLRCRCGAPCGAAQPHSLGGKKLMSENTVLDGSENIARTNAHRPGEHPPDASGPDPKRWLALVVVAIAQLMVVLDATIVNIAMPSAQTALHITDANRQWILTAYTLAFGGLLLLGGRIADYVGAQ